MSKELKKAIQAVVNCKYDPSTRQDDGKELWRRVTRLEELTARDRSA